MKPHPTSLRVIFADSASNQERSPYPPPSRPSPPAAATAVAKSAPAAGVIGARMIGCSMSKNFVNRVLIIRVSSSCGEFDSLFSLRGGLLGVTAHKSARLCHPEQHRGYVSRPRATSPRERASTDDPQSSVASSVILAFNNLDTGQPALAMPTNSANFVLSAPGIFATSHRWTD